jgi:hypothetical protein
LVFENYLNILNDKDNLTLSKFRTTNHKLPVENGGWKNIARENRIILTKRHHFWSSNFEVDVINSLNFIMFGFIRMFFFI